VSEASRTQSALARNPANSSTRTNLQTIQTLRAIAAYMVVVHHATIMYAERLNPGGFRWLSGASGVDIFFVISGLVMGLSSEKLVERAGAAGYFLARRFERIVPLYWLMTTAKIVLLVLAPGLAVNALGTKWHVIASYLFVPSYNSRGVPEPVLVAGWTLSFEMLFYLLFALALSFHVRPVKLLFPVLGTISIVSIYTRYPGAPAIFALCSPLFLEFLYGVILAMILRFGRLPKPASGWLIIAGSFAVLLLTPWGGSSLWRAFLWGLPAAAIVMAALGLELRLKGSIPLWILESGDASYSIYLTHGFALPLVGMLLTRLSLPHAALLTFATILSLLVSAGLGEVTYRLIERPIIDYFGLRRHSIASASN
jgi:exopolysaccharide production protein ExoZ